MLYQHGCGVNHWVHANRFIRLQNLSLGLGLGLGLALGLGLNLDLDLI